MSLLEQTVVEFKKIALGLRIDLSVKAKLGDHCQLKLQIFNKNIE